LFYEMFDGWAKELCSKRPDMPESAFRPFRDRMYGGDFVFNVSRDFVRSCKTPMLILAGNDDYHPAATSKEIAELGPNAEIIPSWKTPNVAKETVPRARECPKAQTQQRRELRS